MGFFQSLCHQNPCDNLISFFENSYPQCMLNFKTPQWNPSLELVFQSLSWIKRGKRARTPSFLPIPFWLPPYPLPEAINLEDAASSAPLHLHSFAIMCKSFNKSVKLNNYVDLQKTFLWHLSNIQQKLITWLRLIAFPTSCGKSQKNRYLKHFRFNQIMYIHIVRPKSCILSKKKSIYN